MEIEVVRPQDLSAARVAHWSQLQSQDIALDSPFLSAEWARAVAGAQGDGGHSFKVSIVRDGGRDLGFFPLRAGAFTALPVGAPMCDYQGLVGEPGLEFDPRALIQAAGVHRYDFTGLLETQAAFAPFARGRDKIHVIDLAGGYDAYEAERREGGSTIFKDCDKKRRKAERDFGPARFTAHARSRADFERLIAWKSTQFRTTGQTDIFKADWTHRLVEALFESRDADFGAVMFTLHFGDELAAVHLHMRGRKTIHAWLIAHDSRFERCSPGILLFRDILRWMDDTPYQRLDLGPGDYQFKRSLANSAQWVTHGFVGGASPVSLVRDAAYRVRTAAESLPFGRLSALPGKAMRRWDVIRSLG